MSAEFVAHMEDVLDLYAQPYDPRRPVVCFDETSTQLLADTRPPLPAQPGRPARQDYEYRREGTRNLFLTCEPMAGWRHVQVTERRTMQDFARQMRWLVDEAYPEVPVVRVVLDNLNTHRTASLYETFPAAEARRVAKRLEFHYTPKHGSWLNMAEIEFSVLSRSCLKQRVPNEPALRRDVQALVTERNAARARSGHWMSTVDVLWPFRQPGPAHDPSVGDSQSEGRGHAPLPRSVRGVREWPGSGQPGKSGRCVEVCARLVLAVGLMRGHLTARNDCPAISSASMGLTNALQPNG